MTDIERYDSINELVIAGEFGFLNVEGPFSVEKEGTLWTVMIPTDGDSAPNPLSQNSLRDSGGKAAVLIADGTTVGGGIVKLADEPEGEGELHVVVDQYAKGR